MTPSEIRDLRERISLSQDEFATGLGMTSARAVRGWEKGARDGHVDMPAPPTLAAMRYLEAIMVAMALLRRGEPNLAHGKLYDALPVPLRKTATTFDTVALPGAIT